MKAMGDTTQAILSVQATQYYYYSNQETKNFIEEIKPRLRGTPVVCWTQTSNAFTVPLSEFTWDKLTRCKRRYSLVKYDPEAMLDVVEKVVQGNGIQKFEFILITDTISKDYNWDAFGDKLKAASFYSNISLVMLLLHGTDPDSVSPKFFRNFHGLPMKVHFEELDVEIQKEIRISSLGSRTAFDFHRFLNDLGQYIYLNSTTKLQRDALIQTLKDLEKKYFDTLSRLQSSCLRPFKSRCSSEKVIRDFIEGKRWSKLKKVYDQTLRQQLLIFAQHKFRRLYDLLEKPEISFNDFKCFIVSQLYSYHGREAFSIINKEEEENIKDDTPDRVPLCIVDQMDPEAPAIHYEANMTLFYRDNTECDDCPFLLLEYFNLAALNNDITCYRRAGDYKKPEPKESEDEESDEYQRVGIILYKFQNIDNPDSELPKPKTREDDVIVETIRALIDWRWGVRRNRGLVAIVFLYALYITDKVQNNEFFKKCIRYTIIRLLLVYKCNLPIFKSEHPHIYVRIYDALMYAVHVSSSEPDPSKNFYTRLRAAGPYFVHFMESIFHEKFPQPVNVRCWLALDYMTKAAEDDKKAMQAIAMTKVVGWTHTVKGPLLLRGLKSDKCYHEILAGLTPVDVFKLKKLVDDDVNIYAKKFDFSMANVDVEVTIPAVESDTAFEETYFFKHVRICESTCRPTFNCPEKGVSWKECVPKELRQRHLSFFNLFGKYCKEHQKYPTDADMMGYLAKSFPLETFYQNTHAILKHITEEYKQMGLKIDAFIERFDKSKTLEKRTQIEAGCNCPAHTPISIKHHKRKSIYVLAFAILLVFSILTCWLYLFCLQAP